MKIELKCKETTADLYLKFHINETYSLLGLKYCFELGDI